MKEWKGEALQSVGLIFTSHVVVTNLYNTLTITTRGPTHLILPAHKGFPTYPHLRTTAFLDVIP